MIQIITKWGDSLAICIPLSLAKEINITEGSEVDLSVVNSSLVIKPKKRKRYSLEELANGITPENRHDLIDFGDSVGQEVW